MASRYNIFFSYSHRDGGIARHLASRLEEAGLRCFLAEKDIAAGEQWEPQIRDAIKAADRILLLITPRSKNSLWVMIEAGAAWALKKELLAALMFVEASELIDPIRRYQARLIETPEQTEALVQELVGQSTDKVPNIGLSGQWIDHTDADIVFFKQVGERVVGFYDYGSGDRKVGIYLGTFRNGILDYRWEWLSGQFEGFGKMKLSSDGERLEGEWWYAKDKSRPERVVYHRVSTKKPSWVSSEDFEKHKAFLAGAG